MKPAHYMIHVSNLSEAITFYEMALGFAVAERHRYQGATLVYMRGPDSGLELELVSPDTWKFAQTPEPGRTHIAFTVDNLDAEHTRITKLPTNAEPIRDYAANGVHQTRYFYFYDPEGNQVEFLESKGRYARERN